MIQPAWRTAAYLATRRSIARLPPTRTTCRNLSTTPSPHRQPRSWKSSTARWLAAGAVVYLYQTSSVFAEEPMREDILEQFHGKAQNPPADAVKPSNQDAPLPTVETLAQQRQETTAAAAATAKATGTQKPQRPAPESDAPPPSPTDADADVDADADADAPQQSAFDEETGEINWDCPCLGGMAHGPCGEQFRAAFSCFVFSKAEPKGVDCVEHFKTMQDCFREHPDLYGGDLEDDEEGGEDADGEAGAGAEGEAEGAVAPQASTRATDESVGAAAQGYASSGLGGGRGRVVAAG